MEKPKILFLNGSLGGGSGNCAQILKCLEVLLDDRSELKRCDLAETPIPDQSLLAWADAFVFTTGTYWDSWGSPMQTFLEQATPLEGTSVWLGKPAVVLVGMHSVGGKGVLSRLQGVLNTLGCQIPPMSGLVYSLVNQIALESENEFAPDLWQLDDLEVIAHNLLAALQSRPAWKAWVVDRKDAHRKWISG